MGREGRVRGVELTNNHVQHGNEASRGVKNFGSKRGAVVWTLVYVMIGCCIGIYLERMFPLSSKDAIPSPVLQAQEGGASPKRGSPEIQGARDVADSSTQPRLVPPADADAKCPRVRSFAGMAKKDESLRQNVFEKVGTNDGRGTTMALVKALDNYCRTQKRPWTLYTYEGLKKESAQAGSLWQMQRMGAVDATRGVHVINELVMTEENLKHWVLPLIDAIPGHGFPGKQFYEATYRNTRHLMREGKMGGFFSTIPPCARQAGRRMDLVSIDTTRHTNVGVLQTLLLHRAVDEHSVFVMESDYWNSAQRTVLTAAAFVARHVALRDVVEYPKTGHDWPWVTFRLNSSVPLKLQHK